MQQSLRSIRGWLWFFFYYSDLFNRLISDSEFLKVHSFRGLQVVKGKCLKVFTGELSYMFLQMNISFNNFFWVTAVKLKLWQKRAGVSVINHWNCTIDSFWVYLSLVWYFFKLIPWIVPVLHYDRCCSVWQPIKEDGLLVFFTEKKTPNKPQKPFLSSYNVSKRLERFLSFKL